MASNSTRIGKNVWPATAADDDHHLLNLKRSLPLRSSSKFKSESCLCISGMSRIEAMHDTKGAGHNDSNNYISIEEDSFSAMSKKKSLKEYDQELKDLKEENFNLKLRIYLMEEEMTEMKDKLFNQQHPVKPVDSQPAIKFAELSLTDSTVATEDSFVFSNLTKRQTKPKRRSESSSLNASTIFNDTDDDDDDDEDSEYDRVRQFKNIEINALNKLNQELEQNNELLKSELNEKSQTIEATRKELERMRESFEQIRIDLTEKFQLDLDRQLEQLRAEFEEKDHEWQLLLNDREEEIARLKKSQFNTIQNYQEAVGYEMDSLTDQLNDRNDQIQKLESNIKKLVDRNHKVDDDEDKDDTTTSPEQIIRNQEVGGDVEQDCKKSETDLYKTEFCPENQLDLFKAHYQGVISDLENQIQLKECLLQKYILIAKDKDAQINHLLFDQSSSEQKLEVFVKELRNNLSDKDTLFEKSLREHFDSLRQKDELVLSLRVQLRQYLNDLNKANEILLQSDNRIDLLQNDLLRLDSSHKHLAYLLEQEVKRNQDLQSSHLADMEEKDQLVVKLRENLTQIKEKLKKKSESTDLIGFYEQQLAEKDQLIKELNAKLSKLNETLTNKVDAKDEQINSVKKSADDKANLLAKENNQLKAELNKVNLELEKLENSFTLQVDEYEVEIENMSNKLKEKENTIKNLITSAEEKDSIIVKLKEKLISLSGENESVLNKTSSLVDLDTSVDDKEQLKKRKTEGLLKLIYDKNQQIDQLKTELNEIKNKNNNMYSSGSMSNLNSSFTNSSASNAKPVSSSGNQQVNFLVDSLNKEIEIYQRLNKPVESKESPRSLKENLQEIIKLRNQLLRETIMRDNHNMIKRRLSASYDNLQDQKSNANVLLSPRQDSNHDHPDSGLNSQKSNSALSSIQSGLASSEHTKPLTPRFSPNGPKLAIIRSSSIPRPLSAIINKSEDFTYMNCSREELIKAVQQATNENLILKRQIDFKTPKITELHNELASMRELCNKLDRINKYLYKQVELYHLTHHNRSESLTEMARKLNLTPEELEQYKEKLNKMQDDVSSVNKPEFGRGKSAMVVGKQADLNKIKEIIGKNKACIAELKKSVSDIKVDLITCSIENNENEMDQILRNGFWCSEAIESKNNDSEIIELKFRLKKYRDEVNKLKDRIKIQNTDIEDAIHQLMLANKEKENTKTVLSVIQTSDHRNTSFEISQKLINAHSRLRKARDNIQCNVELQSNH